MNMKTCLRSRSTNTFPRSFLQVDRHLIKLQQHLDKHDQDHPELAPLSNVPTRSYTIPHGRKSRLTNIDRRLFTKKLTHCYNRYICS